MEIVSIIVLEIGCIHDDSPRLVVDVTRIEACFFALSNSRWLLCNSDGSDSQWIYDCSGALYCSVTVLQ
jgi:hypothetical protein